MSDKTELGDALRDALPTYEAPPSLREWARQRAAEADESVLPEAENAGLRRASRFVRLPLYAAGLLAASALGWMASSSWRMHQQSAATQDALVVALVDTHVRSLMGDHLMDVQSTDQHTVKPWFAGKADFVPPARDLSAKGFSLLGGRIEYVRGHTTAALVYGRRRHIVNVFIWPAVTSDDGTAARTYRGYSLLHWVTGGLSYWCVTDASPTDLEVLRHAYESAPP